MSTRSFVGMMVGDKCSSIYVHSDGYLEGVGAELQSYKNSNDVQELISHGDRSYLDGGFYKDQGETGVEPFEYDSFDNFFAAAESSWAEWYYIFKDGVWYCGNTYQGTELFRKLTPYEKAVKIYSKELELELD